MSIVYASVLFGITANQNEGISWYRQSITVTDSHTTQVYPQIKLMESHLSPMMIGWSTEVDFIEVENFNQYFTIMFQKVIWSQN